MRSLGTPVNAAFSERSEAETASFFRIIMAVVRRIRSKEPLEIEQEASQEVALAKDLCAFYAGGAYRTIARAAWPSRELAHVSFLQEEFRGTTRRPEDPINADLLRLCHQHKHDDLIRYFITSYASAISILDDYVRISRLFSILEGIAAPINSILSRRVNDSTSREAIRIMIGYYRSLDNPRVTITDPEEHFDFDVIELAGQIRQKIFHGGGRLTPANAPLRLKGAAGLLALRPDIISHILKRDCEAAIAQWVKRTGPAIEASNDPNFQIPPPTYNIPTRPRLLVGASREPKSGVATAFAKTDDPTVELRIVSGANRSIRIESRKISEATSSTSI